MFKKEMKKYLIHKGEELKGIEAKYHFSGFSFFWDFFFSSSQDDCDDGEEEENLPARQECE